MAAEAVPRTEAIARESIPTVLTEGLMEAETVLLRELKPREVKETEIQEVHMAAGTTLRKEWKHREVCPEMKVMQDQNQEECLPRQMREEAEVR